jgi:replicative DNA helicase
MTDRLDSSFLEKLIVKCMLRDKRYLVSIANVFEPEYFDDTQISNIFQFTSEYVKEYNNLPEETAIINSVKEDDRQSIQECLNDIRSIEFDVNKSYDYLFTQTNMYLKEQAIKRAILESVDIIDNRSDIDSIRDKINAALSKDMKIDLGLMYFEDLGIRLKRIFTATNVRVPTYYPTFDEFISGGFPPFTLSVLAARIHMGKSLFLANVAARQVLHGKNVVLMTLEMSEDAFAQRFDSIYSLMDINRMYLSESSKKNLVDKLTRVKKTEGRGELFLKQFPTGAASVNHFRMYLRELSIRDIKPDILMVDYINLMKAANRGGDNLYSSVKRITEELRALSFEFEVPVLSVSQLNREGSFVGFEELDFTYIAESLGTAATSDTIMIFGTNEDDMIYESEIHCKFVKNRLGGRVSESCRFYMDSRSLRLLDESELEQWIAEAQITGDERNLFERQERQQRRSRRNE